MKNILKIAFSFYLLLSTFYLYSQVPQKFNYQGIARDAKGNPMARQLMSLKIIVLPTSDATEGEYEEIQSVTTNEFGLYNLQIGNGTPLKGEMKTVKWETGNKYIKVLIDPTGGNDFVDAGTTQLLSVPYAIYADKAGMAKTTNNNDRAGSVSTSASGTGTVNFLTKFTAANTIYNSQLFDNGTNIGIGTITPSAKLHINQNLASVQEHFRMQNLSTTGAGRFTLYSDAATNYSTFTKYGSAFAGSYAGLTGLYPFGNLLAFGNNGLAANDGLGRFLISTAGNAGISIFKGGTSKLKFHADFTTENVGIGGNAAPVSRVHFNNTDGINMDLRLTNTTSGHTATDGLVLTQNGNASSLINRENGELQFGSNNIVSMKLVPTGNLELTNQIKIAGGNPGTGKVLTSDSVGMASWQTIATSNQWVTNGTHIYNSNTGNVGIGTNTPTSKLHIASPFSEIRLQNTAINTSLFITAPFNGGTGGIGTDGNHELPFFTNNVERVVIKNDGRLGIGTNAPAARLHVADSAVVFAHGGTPGTSEVPVIGNGVRMMWMPSKSAFRVGEINASSTAWNPDSIGQYSVAMGINTQAKGISSFAIGHGTFANGYSSAAIGFNSFAIGDYSIALGAGNTAIGNFSAASGYSTTASGDRSTAMGNYTTASGDRSMAIGSGSIAGGGDATAMGIHTIANGWASLAIGQFNDPIVNEQTYMQTTTPLFIIGNGSANSLRNNAMVVRYDGRVGIGTNAPGGQFELSLDQGRKPSTNTWTITSDARLKNITGTYNKGLKEILQLKPITYQYKNVGERKFAEEILKAVQIGFSAQDVQQVFPECVGEDEDGYLNLNTHAIIIAQINAIKELKQENEDTKKLIEILQIQNELLIKRLEALEKK